MQGYQLSLELTREVKSMPGPLGSVNMLWFLYCSDSPRGFPLDY